MESAIHIGKKGDPKIIARGAKAVKIDCNGGGGIGVIIKRTQRETRCFALESSLKKKSTGNSHLMG
jgi:hypothetical protein